MYLYREFGGSLWIRDSRQRLATEISDRAPALALMKQLQGKIVDCLFLLYSLTGPVEAIWIWVGLIYILHLLFCLIKMLIQTRPDLTTNSESTNPEFLQFTCKTNSIWSICENLNS